MKTTISFWYKDECITTIYGDNDNPPFKVGDTFWLSVEDMYPRRKNDLKAEGWKQEFIDRIVLSYEEMRKKYSNEKYRVVKIYRSLNVDPNSNDDAKHHKLNIEYTLKRVRRIYWKFWQTYRFKQFIKNLFKSNVQGN